MSAVINICSNFIPPCPRRHFSQTLWSNGNNCPESADPYQQRLVTHITVGLEVSNVPLDTVCYIPDEPTLGHRLRFTLIVLGRDLSVHSLAMG